MPANVVLQLKSPYLRRNHPCRDVSRLELMQRLAALVPRPRVHLIRFHGVLAPDDVTTYGAQWGGEVAAEKLTSYLKPETVTLYVRHGKERENISQLVAKYRLRTDPQRDIELLDTFWDVPADPEHPDVVPPILVYADLMVTHDPRNLDAARLLYDSTIRHALRPG